MSHSQDPELARLTSKAETAHAFALSLYARRCTSYTFSMTVITKGTDAGASNKRLRWRSPQQRDYGPCGSWAGRPKSLSLRLKGRALAVCTKLAFK